VPAHIDADTQDYRLENDWEHARHRLTLLERRYDAGTIRRLKALGVGTGWRCFEVGAGGGSITRWLCAQVGSRGRVLATDLDTRFVEELNHDNLDVLRMDLRTDELPAEAFDLVHARVVLMHIPQREQILDALLATLRPGGWLFLEEVDDFAVRALATGLHSEVTAAYKVGLEQAGVALDWARQLPEALQHHGLADIGAGCEVSLFEGGSADATFWVFTMAQLAQHGLACGLSASQLAEWNALLSQPGSWFPGLAMVSAWGRRPCPSS
jgi:2-polyprenyl-3-methyl-5-hydroxy-6-metoxy-1,4-benzoquinol methylase